MGRVQSSKYSLEGQHVWQKQSIKHKQHLVPQVHTQINFFVVM